MDRSELLQILRQHRPKARATCATPGSQPEQLGYTARPKTYVDVDGPPPEADDPTSRPRYAALEFLRKLGKDEPGYHLFSAPGQAKLLGRMTSDGTHATHLIGAGLCADDATVFTDTSTDLMVRRYRCFDSFGTGLRGRSGGRGKEGERSMVVSNLLASLSSAYLGAFFNA